MTWVGRDINWAGLEKKKERRNSSWLICYIFNFLQRREYHICFNLLTEIFFSSVCRKSGRLFFITTWLIFLNVSSSGRTTVNVFELNTPSPCPELLFTFIFLVSEHFPSSLLIPQTDWCTHAGYGHPEPCVFVCLFAINLSTRMSPSSVLY